MRLLATLAVIVFAWSFGTSTANAKDNSTSIQAYHLFAEGLMSAFSLKARTFDAGYLLAISEPVFSSSDAVAAWDSLHAKRYNQTFGSEEELLSAVSQALDRQSDEIFGLAHRMSTSPFRAHESKVEELEYLPFSKRLFQLDSIMRSQAKAQLELFSEALSSFKSGDYATATLLGLRLQDNDRRLGPAIASVLVAETKQHASQGMRTHLKCLLQAVEVEEFFASGLEKENAEDLTNHKKKIVSLTEDQFGCDKNPSVSNNFAALITQTLRSAGVEAGLAERTGRMLKFRITDIFKSTSVSPFGTSRRYEDWLTVKTWTTYDAALVAWPESPVSKLLAEWLYKWLDVTGWLSRTIDGSKQ